jgi:hypothetical protein
MSAHIIDTTPLAWDTASPALARSVLAQARGLEIVARLAARSALALVPALAIVAAASLALAASDFHAALQAGLWSTGFLYYAAAFEAERGHMSCLYAALGVTVQGLAAMSALVAPELAIAAAGIAAASLALAIFKRV